MGIYFSEFGRLRIPKTKFLVDSLLGESLLLYRLLPSYSIDMGNGQEDFTGLFYKDTVGIHEGHTP